VDSPAADAFKHKVVVNFEVDCLADVYDFVQLESLFFGAREPVENHLLESFQS